MEILTLIENSTRDEKLIAEFGLSLLVRTGRRTILFDTGSSDQFLKNALKLDVNIRDVDFAVISHAHYDHAGGLRPFLDVNQSARVYMGKSAELEYYGSVCAVLPLMLNSLLEPVIGRSKTFSKYIGIDPSVFKDYHERITFVDGVQEIDQNIFLMAGFEKKHPLTAGNRFLLTSKGDRLENDEFEHEIIMIIKEEDGLVMITGCGHSGLLNMIETVNKKFDHAPIKAIVGGFHLKVKANKEIMAGAEKDTRFLAEELKRHNIKYIYTGHCTGSKAFGILKQILKNGIYKIYTGSAIQL